MPGVPWRALRSSRCYNMLSLTPTLRTLTCLLLTDYDEDPRYTAEYKRRGKHRTDLGKASVGKVLRSVAIFKQSNLTGEMDIS